MSKHIVVVGGGQNAEHQVSLASAASVSTALRARGHRVTELTIGLDGVWQRDFVCTRMGAAESFAAAIPMIAAADLLFPLVHGAPGEDGSLAALCALARVPLVGSGVRAGAIGMDKWATKAVAHAAGIATAPGQVVAAGDLVYTAEPPVVVKPVSAGSSYGVSLARDVVEYAEAVRTASRFDDRVLVEQVVRGREIDVAVLREADGRRWAPPPLEIHASGLFDTATKYDGSAVFTVPASLTRSERAALTSAALTVHRTLGCSGVARMDFFLTEEGPVLNEVNTVPGMTESSQVPRMFAAAGVPYEDLVERLIAGAEVPRVSVGTDL